MFQFPESPFRTLWIHVRISAHYGRWVSPFGHLRINVCLQLPAAFRSLPRPSSASGAKASTLCSLLLDHMTIARHGFILDISLLPYAVFKVRSAKLRSLPPTSRRRLANFASLNFTPESTKHLQIQGASSLTSKAFPFYNGKMVEDKRIELLTPCVQGRCSPS